MKNSGIEWIGEIPDDWKIVYLSSIFNEHKRKNMGLICKNLLSLSYGKIKRKDINTTDGLLPESFEGYNIIENGDIVLRLTDLQNDQKSLRTGIAHETGLITSAYITIRCLPKIALPDYMHYYLHSFDTSKGFYGMGDGVRQGLNYDGIKKILMLLPPINEQPKIADYLDKKCAAVDRLIENQRAQIEKLKEYKQSVITEAVTRGLDPSAPMKDSGIEWIGEITESRKIIRLKFLLSQNMAYGANESGDKNFTDSVRYIRITDITADGKLKNDEDNQYLLKEKAKEYILADKDILFARSGGTVGKTFLYRNVYGECAYAGYLIQAKCNPIKLLPEYLMYYTQSSLYSLWKNMIFIQATIQNIGANKYSNLEIVVMDIKEQKMIVSYLDKKCAEIDKLIAIKQQKIETLTEYKKSLIYEYVTGKKQVG